MISIVIPTYNRKSIISTSIESVLIQKDKNFEIIIVDDGSTDDTSTLVKNYICENPCIKYYRYEINKGVNYARNLGVKMAKGKFVLFLDSDDTLYTEQSIGIVNKYITDYPNKKIFKFASINSNGEKNSYICKAIFEPDSIKDFFDLRKIHGEFLTVIEKNIMLDNPFIDSINGFESITWYEIEKKYNDAHIYIDEILRFYNLNNNSLTRGISLTRDKVEKNILGYEMKLKIMGEDLKLYNPRKKEGYAVNLAVLSYLYAMEKNMAKAYSYNKTAFFVNPLEPRIYRNIAFFIKYKLSGE